MDEAPLVTVIIPTYNRAVFVTKALESVLNQSFTDYEIIVVDDGSTDTTKEVLAKYEDRIKYVYQDNSGVSSARNTGIMTSRGKWLAFLDSDDEWKQDYLAKQIIQTQQNTTQLCMQSTNCRFTDIDGSSQAYFSINGAITAFKGRDYLLISKPFSFVVTHGPWQIGSTIFLRDAIIDAGLFDTSMTVSEDFDVMARVSLQGHFGLINEELVNIYRRNELTECLSNQFKKDLLGFKVIEESMYQKLRLTKTLRLEERRALNKVISAKKRAIGNLFLQAGNLREARDCFRGAFYLDLSVRSLGRYILCYVPQKRSGGSWI
jgi:glycosyltransferase involved in cell wall biosynthesis